MPAAPLPDWAETGGPDFVNRVGHRQWLLSQANALLEFYQPQIINRSGGFHVLDTFGHQIQAGSVHSGLERQLHDTTRMVHCFAIAKLMDRFGADDIIDHGMNFLWSRHRDAKNGGYFWGVNDAAATNSTKQAYGHAFVMLAAASAKTVGHPDADRLLTDVTEVILTRFWEPENGATSEEYSADWQAISEYRGQNSNMHLTEALMAAHEVTNDQTYLDMANSIADLIINRHARQQGWRVAEHFNADWQVDRAYAGDPMFRPAGTTPGHALEWARLLIQLWELGKRHAEWMPKAAKHLFMNAVKTGWDHASGGFFYTLNWDDTPDQTDRFWWPCAEAIGAATVLTPLEDDPVIETWYRRIWGFVDSHMIDHKHGGWFPELDSDLRPKSRVFTGKPDLYHALQACLIPLLPTNGSIINGLTTTKLDVEGIT